MAKVGLQYVTGLCGMVFKNESHISQVIICITVEEAGGEGRERERERERERGGIDTVKYQRSSNTRF